MINYSRSNITRTYLLSYINNESIRYIKERSQSKVNGETAKEIASKYETFEVVIDSPLYVGIKNGKIKTTLQMEIEDECTILKVSEYINDLTKRKILFSKYKIKNIEDKSPIRKQFDNKNEKYNEMKQAILFLGYIANRLKKMKILKKPTRKANMSGTVKSSMTIRRSSHKINLNPKTVKSSTSCSKDYSFKISLHPLNDDSIIYTKSRNKIHNSPIYNKLNQTYRNKASLFSTTSKTHHQSNEHEQIFVDNDSSVSDF